MNMVSFMLFFQPLSAYIQNDSYTEQEKNIFSYFCSSIPVEELTISTLISMSLNSNLITNECALELIHKLVYRASLMNVPNALNCADHSTIEGLFHLTQFKESNNSNIFVRKFFWDFVTITTILTCYNPMALGAFSWKIPCVKLFLELLIKNQFYLPNELKEEEVIETLITDSQTISKKENEEITQFCKEMSLTSGNSKSIQIQKKLKFLKIQMKQRIM
jgi:hypothetical protein